ncbi:MAG TPA: hypothetical protein VIK86_04490 [Candidatus Paceibacterota bacterium]
MINNLSSKALDEKYFNSIRYFSHLLQGTKRSDFIAELSEHNIYLAAQCLMSAEKNDILEHNLKTKAAILANDFNNTEKSAKGFLALGEFESYEIILKLLTSITKPNNVHQQIFNKIFSESDSFIYLKFFDVIIKVNQPSLITYLISAFNKEIIVTTDNKESLKNILNYFLDNKLYNLFRLFIDKFELSSELSFILNKDTIEIIQSLKGQASYKSVKLCYYLASGNNIFDTYSPRYFVEQAVQHNAKKALMFALRVCIRHNLSSIPEIDSVVYAHLQQVTSKSTKKNRKLINALIRSGLIKYADNNELMKKNIAIFLMDNSITVKTNDELEELFESNLQPDFDHSSLFHNSKTILELFDNYFDNRIIERKIKIEEVIKVAITRFDSSYKEISLILRKYEFNGEIYVKKDFGCYIISKELNTFKYPFIHYKQIYEEDSEHKYESLNVGDKVRFRIIGINQESFRINTSCLSQFRPIDSNN